MNDLVFLHVPDYQFLLYVNESLHIVRIPQLHL